MAKHQIVIIDNGRWEAQTLEYEIINKNDSADVKKKITVPETATIKEILDLVGGSAEDLEWGEEIRGDPEGEHYKVKVVVGGVQSVWLPYTVDEFAQKVEEFNKIRDQYPWLSVHFAYQGMTKSYLHELARHYNVVHVDSTLDKQGNTHPPEPKVAVGDNPKGKETLAKDPNVSKEKGKKTG